MKIRLAKDLDKSNILKFCKNTFSWGDYIEDAWDHWLKEGHLFLLENDSPFGISHCYFSDDQVWIEGIRIDPKYRRKNYATKLITNIENLAKQKGKSKSFMLTDVKNTSSILLAKKCRYSITQTWNFYLLEAQYCNSNKIQFSNLLPDYITHYVKSWRWLPLNYTKKSELYEKNKIITAKNSGNSYAILTDSTRFGKTLVVTLFSGDNLSTKNILCYVQNFAVSNNYKRIEILTKEELPIFNTLKLKNSFYLFKKDLD